MLKSIWLYHFFFLAHIVQVYSQPHSYSFSEIDRLQKTEKKDIVVFIHTDGCKYCQLMKNTSFKNKRIIEILNKNFLFTDLNAEYKDDIIFNDHLFKYIPSGYNVGTHQLAVQLGTIDGQVTYPTLCILNSEYEIIFQYGQYLSASELESVLQTVLKRN